MVDQDPKDWFWEEAIAITSGTYDPETGTIKLELDFAGDPMKVTCRYRPLARVYLLRR